MIKKALKNPNETYTYYVSDSKKKKKKFVLGSVSEVFPCMFSFSK